MNDDSIENANVLFNDEVVVPDIMNKSVVLKMLHESFDQVSSDTAVYINCLLYATLEHVIKKTKARCDAPRIYPKHVQEAITGDGTITINVGKINVNPDISMDKIVQEVIKALALNGLNTVDYGKLLEGEDLSTLGGVTNE